jgi:precorrin-6A synthase
MPDVPRLKAPRTPTPWQSAQERAKRRTQRNKAGFQLSTRQESNAMRQVLIIGIGAGNPDYVTVQAINALNRADVFFIPDKGTEKEALQRLRLDICERYIKDRKYRLIDFKTPERSNDPSNYKSNVQDWHSRIEQNYEKLLTEELGDGQCGAFLVWGDPTLYDSTLRIIDKIKSKGGLALEYEVIPGISSIQALAARHRIALNRIGESIHITTGRKLRDGFPDNADSVVVLLDGEQSFKKIDGSDIDIYWGAYLGTENEILVSGRLSEVANDIEAVRAKARREHGWIMDSYLLRKSEEK